jgi:hypothetical protein
MVWTGFIWLRIGTIGGLLWTRWWTFGFHKMLGSSWVAAKLAASQEGLSSVSKYPIQNSLLVTEPRTRDNNITKKKKRIHIWLFLSPRISDTQLWLLHKYDTTPGRNSCLCILITWGTWKWKLLFTCQRTPTCTNWSNSQNERAVAGIQWITQCQYV